MWTILAQAAAEAKEAGGSGVPWPQIILAIVGPAGLIGSIVALFKLKPDANTQAVTQAQGAATEWKSIADDRKAEIAALESKLLAKDAELEKCRSELERCRRQRS